MEEIGATVITQNKRHFKDHKMGALKLESFFLDKQRKIKLRDTDTCVVDYIWEEVRGKRGFKTYIYEKLYNELSEYATNFPLMSTQEIIDWVRNCHNNVSLHAYSATYKKFMKHISQTPDIQLVYITKDHHLYKITNEQLKKIVSTCNQSGDINLFNHLCELKGTRRHEKFTMLQTLEKEEELIFEEEEEIMKEEQNLNKIKDNKEYGKKEEELNNKKKKI